MRVALRAVEEGEKETWCQPVTEGHKYKDLVLRVEGTTQG
jgi:hypothetical protein